MQRRTPTSQLTGDNDAADPPISALSGRQRVRRWFDLRWSPVVFTALNGVLFLLIRPDVNDLWAARARASAARNGVGLTYWFSWFGGGSTPGNYSILTPYVSAYLSAELVCALAAVAVVAASTLAVRGTRHPLAAGWVAAAATVMNLWSGRVPFLLGMAFAVLSLVLLMRGRVVPAALAAVLGITSSPVAGAFLLVALMGVFFGTQRVRRSAPIVAVVSVVAIGVIGLLFGAPGPQPFGTTLLVSILISTVLYLCSGQPTAMRYALYVMVLVNLVLYLIPNGMGSNISRLYWFCLPVAAVALSRRRAWVAATLVTPMLIYGVSATLVDLHNAARPTAGKTYYQPLIDQLKRQAGLSDYRLEVVAQNEHAAYDALLNYAMLARGWETQEDQALNSAVLDRNLDAITYRVWLENNAVGFVALPTIPQQTYPEFNLVASGQLDYLDEMWSNADWTLFRVDHPTPVVAKPAALLQHGQAKLTIRVPCECKINIRIRYSKYLNARAPGGVSGDVVNDGYGWTNLVTSAPGTYVLTGSLTRVFG